MFRSPCRTSAHCGFCLRQPASRHHLCFFRHLFSSPCAPPLHFFSGAALSWEYHIGVCGFSTYWVELGAVGRCKSLSHMDLFLTWQPSSHVKLFHPWFTTRPTRADGLDMSGTPPWGTWQDHNFGNHQTWSASIRNCNLQHGAAASPYQCIPGYIT